MRAAVGKLDGDDAGEWLGGISGAGDRGRFEVELDAWGDGVLGIVVDIVVRMRVAIAGAGTDGCADGVFKGIIFVRIVGGRGGTGGGTKDWAGVLVAAWVDSRGIVFAHTGEGGELCERSVWAGMDMTGLTVPLAAVPITDLNRASTDMADTEIRLAWDRRSSRSRGWAIDSDKACLMEGMTALWDDMRLLACETERKGEGLETDGAFFLVVVWVARYYG
jgi:hypothetical protein